MKLVYRLTIKKNIYKLDLPLIFKNMVKNINIAKLLPINVNNLNHEQILDELTKLISKYYYSDNNNTFIKSFGVKTVNYTDIYFNLINNIDDKMILVDDHRYAFSFDDLDNVKSDTIHPYLGNILLSESIMYNSKCKLFDYYCQMTNKLPVYVMPITNNIIDRLAELINNYYFTNNLIEIYQNHHSELDYTVELIIYIISKVHISDCFCAELFENNYKYVAHNNKYNSFICVLIKYIEHVNRNYSNLPNVSIYIGILLQRILEYRYNILVMSKELYECIKKHFNIQVHNKLYKSIQLDCSNYLHSNNSSDSGFMNINIDTVFSNCNPMNYYRIMMYYLHYTYMSSLDENDFQINDYTKPEYYSYLNILKYFVNLYDFVIKYNLLDAYIKMIQRYYLQDNSILIMGDYIYD